MLSIQGNRILLDLYSGFRDEYLDRHPGSNENDVERAFLCDLSVMVYGDLSADTRDRIQKIR